VAGAQGNITFSEAALYDIYLFSDGIPRLINLLCDRALLAAFVEQTYHIDKEIIHQAKGSLLGKEEETGLTRVLIRFFRRSFSKKAL
jgi:general secretion pathway protein A